MARVKHVLALPNVAERVNFEFGFSNRLKSFNINSEEMRRSIDGITYATTPPEMLSRAIEGVMNLFYFADADSTYENSALKYYRQREWRIAGNIIGYMGEGLMGLPSKTLSDRLLALDPDFFGREFPRKGVTPTNPSLNNQTVGDRLIDWVFVYQGIDERHIIGAARRVIVPREAMQPARAILTKHFKRSNPPPVVPIEEL
jgi:hypothetical protein